MSYRLVYHNDHLGSLRALTTQAGTVEGKQDYYPYGEKLSSGSYADKYSYNGKEWLDDWGFDLYYYGARFMDPNTGRFITPDPIQDYLNQYSYVGNNPVNRIDPTGMLTEPSLNYHLRTGYDFGGDPYRELRVAGAETRHDLNNAGICGYKHITYMKIFFQKIA